MLYSKWSLVKGRALINTNLLQSNILLLVYYLYFLVIIVFNVRTIKVLTLTSMNVLNGTNNWHILSHMYLLAHNDQVVDSENVYEPLSNYNIVSYNDYKSQRKRTVSMNT